MTPGLKARWAALILAATGLVVAGWVLWPARQPPATPSPDEARVLAIIIPQGTARKIMAGEKAAAFFPSEITLTAGVKDILMIRNEDETGHGVGPLWIGGGETLTLRFDRVGTYTLGCSLDPQHVFRIVVREPPARVGDRSHELR